MTIPMEESPKWFEGAALNIAENLLKFRDNRVALILAGLNSIFPMFIHVITVFCNILFVY